MKAEFGRGTYRLVRLVSRTPTEDDVNEEWISDIVKADGIALGVFTDWNGAKHVLIKDSEEV